MPADMFSWLPASIPSKFRWLDRAARTPAGRALGLTAVLWLLALFYCKHKFWRDPHSAFFDSSTVYDQGYSLVRSEEGLQFLSAASSRADESSLDPVICAGIVTVRRDPVQYLNKTIGSMLAGLTVEERSALHIRLLFAESEPQMHPDYHQRWLGQLESAETYVITGESLEHLRELEKARNFFEKGVFDYIYMLNQCVEHTSAPFVAIFEDDIIFADGWLSKTVKGLTELQKSTTWLYLRLFYTETSLRWRNEQDFWFRYLWLTVVLAALMFAALASILRRTYKPLRSILTNHTIVTMAVVAMPAFTILYFMIGKYNVLPLSGVERMDRYGCCTQALVFPRSQVPDLVAYLVRRKSGQTDTIIEEYADEFGLERYALAPQVVQHVGLVSSRDNLEINTKSTWAFWFEASDAAQLQIEHQELAKWAIWRARSHDHDS
ncbi:hypothetical protein QM012_002527 [Aureobasidium pullulans]|uniref:Integral membrane protein n=1 Tax=Aureobasidium pullulans TaxID=5580 RepID=A0ABR0TCL5_AURPU